MEERMLFVAGCRSGLYTIMELCERFGISRKTGYKWLGRYEREGTAGLSERSSAPHTRPQTTPAQVSEALLAARRAHKHWGPRKLLVVVAREQPELAARLPAASTVGEILKAAGQVQPRRRRDRPVHLGGGPLQAQEPNAVWCADFKGQFATLDGRLCYPLTLTDACSRYLLACDALYSTEHTGALETFERLFRQVGLPQAIRTDNGGPFCSPALCGLSRLSVWWLKLGIAHQRIRPGQPQENGRHERMHRTLKAEATRPPAADLAAQQARFEAFRQEYNQERPHEALQMQTPASLWTPSGRCLPEKLPEPQYASHLLVRTVRTDGSIKFKGHWVYVSQVLCGETVGLEEGEEGVWSLYFYSSLLARLDEKQGKQGKEGMRVVPAGPAGRGADTATRARRARPAATAGSAAAAPRPKEV